MMWWLQDIKLGPGAQPADDIVILTLPIGETAPDEAQRLVRRKMHGLSINKSSVQGVRIIDDQGQIVARCTAWDEIGNPYRDSDA